MSNVVAVTWRLKSSDDAAELLTLASRCGDLTWLNLGPLAESAAEAGARHGVISIIQVTDPKLEPAGILRTSASQLVRTKSKGIRCV